MVAALNMTVVSAALPRIAADLKGLDHFHWVFTGYIVTAAASLPIFGKLSDMYGRKLFFSIGLIILMIGSALSGIAQDIFQLSIFRALAGIGAGALIANSMSIVGELFTPKEQPKWRALNQGVFAISNICGPLVGGLLTDHLSWRWVFFMNIPVAASALVYASFVLPPFYYRGRRHRIDFLGAVLLLAFVIPLLVGVSLGGRQLPWGSWQVVGAALGIRGTGGGVPGAGATRPRAHPSSSRVQERPLRHLEPGVSTDWPGTVRDDAEPAAVRAGRGG